MKKPLKLWKHMELVMYFNEVVQKIDIFIYIYIIIFIIIFKLHNAFQLQNLLQHLWLTWSADQISSCFWMLKCSNVWILQFVSLIEVEEHDDDECKKQSAVFIYTFFNLRGVKIINVKVLKSDHRVNFNVESVTLEQPETKQKWSDLCTHRRSVIKLRPQKRQCATHGFQTLTL